MIRVEIDAEVFSQNLKVYIIEDVQGGKMLSYDHEGKATEHDVQAADFAIEPTFVFKESLVPQLLQALADRGFKTDNDHKIAGTLDATRDHLKDMQKIVFDHQLLNNRTVTVEGDNTGSITA